MIQIFNILVTKGNASKTNAKKKGIGRAGQEG